MVSLSLWYHYCYGNRIIFVMVLLSLQDPNDNSMLVVLIGYSCIKIRVLLLLLLCYHYCYGNSIISIIIVMVSELLSLW